MKNLFVFFAILFAIIGAACREQEIVDKNFDFVYLTWTENDIVGNQSVRYLSSESKSLELRLYEDKKLVEAYKSEVFSIPSLKKLYRHSFELKNLKQAKKYQMEILSSEQTLLRRESFYSADSKSIRFAVGGDTGADSRFRDLVKIAARHEPQMMLFGGDIAYANGRLSNWRSWYDWFQIYERHARRKDGSLIPLLTAIGNHEVNSPLGTNSFEAPFWYLFFHVNTDKRTFYSKKWGDLLLISLDSGHVYKHKEQVSFLEDELKRSDVKYKIPFYHVPLYPAHRDITNDLSQAGLRYWGPLFEEHQIKAGLEHHDHVLKRTKPLRDQKLDFDKGIVYFGDGAMGRRPRDINRAWYLEKSSADLHFWLVEEKAGRFHYSAYGLDSKQLDSYSN